jgi:hypothetical protein
MFDMQHIDTRIDRRGGMITVSFIGEGGEHVEVTLQAPSEPMEENQFIDRAKAAMVHLTAFGTRDGGGSLNAYDALSNGNFDGGEPLMREPSPFPVDGT